MLDLRLPVGIFFLIIGVILALDGLVHPVMTPGVHLVLNRDWGFCLIVFGGLMTGFGAAAQKKNGGEQNPAKEPGQVTRP
jgi:hypothetical protein